VTRPRAEQRAAAAKVPRWGTPRAEKHKDRSKPPTQRAKRGAQMVGQRDMERGVTSRARKSKQGTEAVADPRQGGRPGRRRSKWGPR
jgi:hypothetical protein